MSAHFGRFVAYYRVSIDKQGQSGLGLDAQHQAVMNYLNGGPWRLVEEFTEVDALLEIDAFHRERLIPVRRGRSRHVAEQFHIRFCFSDTATADAEREQGETISYGVLDPSAFKEDGGPSIAERIARGSGGKVWLRHADNTRVPSRGAMAGWDQMRSRLVGDGDGRPMIVTFSTCVDS